MRRRLQVYIEDRPTGDRPTDRPTSQFWKF